MAKTNMRENEGGALILLADSQMLLVCGPIEWDNKQDGTPWAGERPTKMRVSLAVAGVNGGDPATGQTGVLDEGANPTLWAAAIPLSSEGVVAAQDHADARTSLRVTGTKVYVDFSGESDDLSWVENLPVIVAPAPATSAA